MLDRYVKPGQVSWEFRNYLLHALDLTAALIARCNGAESFFPLSRALYRRPAELVGKIQAAPQDKLAAAPESAADQQFVAMASLAGLQDWAAARGMPAGARATSAWPTRTGRPAGPDDQRRRPTNIPDFQGTPTSSSTARCSTDTATWDSAAAAARETR